MAKYLTLALEITSLYGILIQQKTGEHANLFQGNKETGNACDGLIRDTVITTGNEGSCTIIVHAKTLSLLPTSTVHCLYAND